MTAAAAHRMRRALLAVFTVFIVGMFAVSVLRMATQDDAGVAALKLAAARAKTQPGAKPALPLHEIRFHDGDGRMRSIADLPRGMMPLNVWATWCPPCREKLPDLDRLQGMLGSERLRVIAPSMGEGGLPAVKSFYRQVHVRALEPYASTPGSLRPLRVSALPTTLLIADGRETWRVSGSLPWSRSDVVELLRIGPW